MSERREMGGERTLSLYPLLEKLAKKTRKGPLKGFKLGIPTTLLVAFFLFARNSTDRSIGPRVRKFSVLRLPPVLLREAAPVLLREAAPRLSVVNHGGKRGGDATCSCWRRRGRDEPTGEGRGAVPITELRSRGFVISKRPHVWPVIRLYNELLSFCWNLALRHWRIHLWDTMRVHVLYVPPDHVFFCHTKIELLCGYPMLRFAVVLPREESR